MADAYSQTISGEVATTLGGNSRKTTQDRVNFGTPDIRPLVIDKSSGNWDNSDDPNSDFHKVMAVIQTRCEIYAIGQISNDKFTLLVNSNTLAADDGDPQAPTTIPDLDYLQNEINSATGIAVRVYNGKIVGNTINYDDC